MICYSVPFILAVPHFLTHSRTPDPQCRPVLVRTPSASNTDRLAAFYVIISSLQVSLQQTARRLRSRAADKRICCRFLYICYTFLREQSCCRVALTFILHRMEVMSMKHFDFKDLMAFGMFILALLTFIYMICH